MKNIKTSSEAADSIRLVPAKVDFNTPMTQLVLAMIVPLIVAAVLFAVVPSLPFIKEDAPILNIVPPNSNMNFNAMMKQAPSLLGYGPVAVGSLALDFRLLHANAVVFHGENLLLYAICVFLVAQIASQLAARGNNRFTAPIAIWSALLFAVAPGNAQALVSAAGRADLLCELFGLSSLFFYFRFRALREYPYLALALASFALAMLTRSPAIVIPVLIALSELLVFTKDKSAGAARFSLPMFFFAVVFFIATISAVLPWKLPTSSVPADLAHWRSLIINANLWNSLLFGPVALHNPVLLSSLQMVYAVAAALLLVRAAVLRSLFWRPLLWLVAWLALSFVPGSVLMGQAYNSTWQPTFPSVPLSILLAFLCLPAIDAIKRKQAENVALVGTLILVVLTTTFGLMTSSELHIWKMETQVRITD